MITNPVGKWILTDCTSMLGSAWKAQIDANFAVSQRVVGPFAPRPANVMNMTVVIDAGFIFKDGAVAEVAAQTTAAFVAPVTNSRIDRIVADRATGAISVVAGTAAPVPVPPAIPTGKNPIAQVLIGSATTVLTNASIFDERALSSLGLSMAAFAGVGANIVADANGNLVDTLPYQNKTVAYSLVSADRNTQTNFTITVARTVTALAPATAGAGWKTCISNDPTSTANLTVARASGGNFYGLGINNQTTFTLLPGQSCWIGSNATDYRVTNLTTPSGAAINSYTNLLVTTGASPLTQVKVTADALILIDSNGNPLTVRAVNATATITTVGLNGRDAGSEAANTWYWVYVISDGSTVGVLFSTSATAPTMPGAYTYKMLVGVVRNNASSNFIDFNQDGDLVQYVTPLNLFNGSAGTYSLTTPTYATTSITSLVATARAGSVVIISAANWAGASGSGAAYVAPNTGYGGQRSSNPPPIISGVVNGDSSSSEFILESTSLAIMGQNSSSGANVMGFRLNL